MLCTMASCDHLARKKVYKTPKCLMWKVREGLNSAHQFDAGQNIFNGLFAGLHCL